jgi:limonene 1,2-monooxygenase
MSAPMTRLQFGSFLAPHHPLGEHPTLQYQRDLDFVELLDRLGYDEFWCGEHHSSGWETIASPEMFLAAAGQRSHTIRLGTGVVSLPYHHPFNVAQRMVQLDHMTRGRAMFGTGPGALPSDAHTLGIDPMVQRDRQDEALGVIRRLLAGEDRFSYESEWFTMRDAALQTLPLQEKMPMAVASTISPSGMQLAGKYGIGALSIASTSTAGLAALPTQWGFAEEAARLNAQVVDRRDWRVLMSWHLAETREQARNEAVNGLYRWNNEYNVEILGRPGAVHVDDKWDLLNAVAMEGGASVIGTPDDLVSAIRRMQAVTGGFGVVLGFAHDWANQEATARSWDLVARYVVPEINRYTVSLQQSADFCAEHKGALVGRAEQAVLSKILAHEGAARALADEESRAVTKAERAASRARSGKSAGAKSTARQAPTSARHNVASKKSTAKPSAAKAPKQAMAPMVKQIPSSGRRPSA